MILGAVLAGGASSRFGSDKALAEIDGERLIDRTVAALGRQCEAVVVCGRTWPGVQTVADRPSAGLGPLGGLAGALALAKTGGYAAVLTAPCDVPDLPDDLLARLAPAPAYLIECPVIGLWPAALAEVLDRHLADGGRRSMRAWAEVAGARGVTLDHPMTNINRPEDLATYRAQAAASVRT